MLVRLDKGSNKALNFEPGDHLTVFPSNDPAMVNKIIQQLENAPSPDSPITIKKCTSNGAWEAVSRLPAKCTLRQGLTSFIDITTPPTQDLLGMFANLVSALHCYIGLYSLHPLNYKYHVSVIHHSITTCSDDDLRLCQINAIHNRRKHLLLLVSIRYYIFLRIFLLSL